jgi:hypothetical protein
MVVNPRVLDVSGDTATARTYYLLASFQNDVCTVRGTGRYEETLERGADGEWRIKELVAYRNVVFMNS